MLLRAQLRAIVAKQLILARTAAGNNVVEHRVLPTKAVELPIITLSTPVEVKTSRGRGAPKFDTIVHLRVDARVSGSTGELAAMAVEALLEQIELAILANSAVVNLCQQFVAVETRTMVDAEGGSPIATGTIMFQAELPQFYDPATPVVLTEIDVIEILPGGEQRPFVKVETRG